jgi:tetratricopeptide (TPR) repeat protein
MLIGPEPTLQSYRDEIADILSLIEQDPDNIQRQSELVAKYNSFGGRLVDAGFIEDALRIYRDALSLANHHVDRKLDDIFWLNHLSFSHDRIGAIQCNKGQHEDALDHFRKCLAIHERLEKGFPKTTMGQRNIARDCDKIGLTLIHLGRDAEGVQAQRDAFAIKESLPEVERENREWLDGYR